MMNIKPILLEGTILNRFLYLKWLPIVVTFFAVYMGVNLSTQVNVIPGEIILKGTLIGLAILIFYKPVYGIYMIIIEELILVPFVIHGKSIGLIIVLITLASTALNFKSFDFRLDQRLMRLFKYILIYSALMLVSLSINGYLLSYSKYVFLPIFFMIIIILFAVHMNSEKRLKMFCKVALIGAALSASVGIAQFFIKELFFIDNYIQFLISNPIFELRPNVQFERFLLLSLEGRAIGLNNDPIAFSKTMTVIAAIVVPFTFLYRRKNIFFTVLVTIIWGGLLFGFLRSAVGGAFIGLLYVLYKHNMIMKTKMGAFLMLLILISPVLSNFSEGNLGPQKMATLIDDSALSRIEMSRNAIMLGVRNPIFGIGPKSAINAQEKLEAIGTKSITVGGTTLKSYKFGHNAFLNVWTNFGLPVLIILAFVYREVFRLLQAIIRSTKSSFIYILSYGLMAGLIADVINTLFHNAGPDYLIFWLVTSLSVSIYLIERKRIILKMAMSNDSEFKANS